MPAGRGGGVVVELDIWTIRLQSCRTKHAACQLQPIDFQGEIPRAIASARCPDVRAGRRAARPAAMATSAAHAVVVLLPGLDLMSVVSHLLNPTGYPPEPSPARAGGSKTSRVRAVGQSDGIRLSPPPRARGRVGWGQSVRALKREDRALAGSLVSDFSAIWPFAPTPALPRTRGREQNAARPGSWSIRRDPLEPSPHAGKGAKLGASRERTGTRR